MIVGKLDPPLHQFNTLVQVASDIAHSLFSLDYRFGFYRWGYRK
jgi:hypothetical protein